MRPRLYAPLTLALVFLAESQIAAQEPLLQPGERVRFKAPRIHDGTIRGWVVEIRGDTLIVDAQPWPSFWEEVLEVSVENDAPRRLRVPFDDLTSVKVARGKKTNWLGAVGAGAVTAAFGLFLAGASHGCCSNDDVDETRYYIAAAGLGVAATVGVGLFMKTDRWVDVTPRRLRVTVAPFPGRGVAVALSLRF